MHWRSQTGPWTGPSRLEQNEVLVFFWSCNPLCSLPAASVVSIYKLNTRLNTLRLTFPRAMLVGLISVTAPSLWEIKVLHFSEQLILQNALSARIFLK